MPNWVFNTLTVEGNVESVTELKNQVSAPYVMPVEERGDLNFVVKDVEVKQDFSFWNIIRPTDMHVYPEQPVRSELEASDPNWWADTMKLSKLDDSWYNWNMRNWGVKWDAKESELVDESTNGDNLVLVYKFDTPWGIPLAALEKLSEQYPNLLLTLEYEEETGWGGEMEFLRGEAISESEYDDKCWECDKTNTIEYCETCEVSVCSSCKFTREEGKCEHEL
jgi:hypothetical protein